MTHVEKQRLQASVRSERVRAPDELAHCLRVHSQVGQAAASHNVLGLGDGLADPRSGALEREGAVLELLVKLFSFVVYTVLDDHRGTEVRCYRGARWPRRYASRSPDLAETRADCTEREKDAPPQLSRCQPP